MEVDSLPVEPACFSFLFFLIYVCLKKKKKDEEGKEEKSPLLEITSVNTGSFVITNWKAILQKFSHFSSMIQLIEGLN